VLIRSELEKEGAMTPTEFAARMVAADQHFTQALKRDDLRDMRAALAEEAGLLADYFGLPRARALGGEDARQGPALSTDTAPPR
jgi:hypothetical protein